MIYILKQYIKVGMNQLPSSPIIKIPKQHIQQL